MFTNINVTRLAKTYNILNCIHIGLQTSTSYFQSYTSYIIHLRYNQAKSQTKESSAMDVFKFETLCVLRTTNCIIIKHKNISL